MAPPDQSLKLGDPPGLEFDQRLVVQFEFVSDQCSAQVQFQQAALIDPRIHFGFKEANAAASFGFGEPQRDIGILQQLAGGQAVAWRQSRANADANYNRMPIGVKRFPKRIGNTFRQQFHVIRPLDPDLDDTELVRAKARHGIDLSYAGQQPLTRALQQHVADQMPKRVVDQLEAIQIQAQHRTLLATAHQAHRLLQPLMKECPVRQLRQ